MPFFLPEVPEPMSDLFLRRMVREMGPRLELAPIMGVSKPEIDTVMADPLLNSDEEKMIKVRIRILQ